MRAVHVAGARVILLQLLSCAKGERVEEQFRYKMSVVLRSDLGMSVGKMVSQACHACLEVSEQAKRHHRRVWGAWMKEGARKVVLQVDSLAELLELEKRARLLDLPHAIIQDRGLTEIPAGSKTALAVGPGMSKVVDKVTGSLKLLK